MIDEDELWLLSYYRTSEISGALFFGRVARTLRPGHIQVDLSHHFADEAQHAWYWTRCIDCLGRKPLKLERAYQDQYAAVGGTPANLLEVLAVTQVFERRVIGQYARHLRRPGLDPVVRETLETIIADERWHLRWVRDALREMEPEHGAEAIRSALRRYGEADEAIYARTLAEVEERAALVFRPTPGEPRHVR